MIQAPGEVLTSKASVVAVGEGCSNEGSLKGKKENK